MDAEESEAVSSSELLDELTRLRMGFGISYRRVKDCSALLRLVAVSDEMQHCGYSRLDRHLAGFNVLQCAVNKSIKSAQQRQILRITLNFDRAGSNIEGEEPKLGKRRLLLQQQFIITANTYLDRETEAYDELASVLATLTTSPCRDLESTKAVFEDIDLVLGDAAESVVKLLLLLSGEKSDMLRERLARVLVGLLPTANAIMPEDATAHSFLSRLVYVVHQHGQSAGSQLGLLPFGLSDDLRTTLWILIHDHGRRSRDVDRLAVIELSGLLLSFERENRWPRFQHLRLRSSIATDLSESFLAVEEVARIVGVSKMTVYRLVHSGELRAFRVGRSFRISRSDLVDFAAVAGIPLELDISGQTHRF